MNGDNRTIGQSDNRQLTPETDAVEHAVGWYEEMARVVRAGFARKLERERDEARRMYSELLMAVERKFPDETRHQTALRYIVRAEKTAGDATQLAVTGKDGG